MAGTIVTTDMWCTDRVLRWFTIMETITRITETTINTGKETVDITTDIMKDETSDIEVQEVICTKTGIRSDTPLMIIAEVAPVSW